MNIGTYKHEACLDAAIEVLDIEHGKDRVTARVRWVIDGIHNSWYCPAPAQIIVIGSTDLPKWKLINLKPRR